MKKSTLLLLLLLASHSIFANKTNNVSTSAVNNIQIIRLDFTAPNGATRELLLGFTSDNSASDGVDYGYDASVSSPFANDLNWLIEEDRYVIQGVGAYQDTSQYLFGMYSETSGEAKIELSSLENFETNIEVYIYDSLLDTYTNINDGAYINNIDAGNYTERFFIAFNQPSVEQDSDIADNSNVLSIDEFELDNSLTVSPEKNIKISYQEYNNVLNISTENKDVIKEINIYSYNGATIQSLKTINTPKTILYLSTDDKNLIVHIITENETIVKQVVLAKS